MKLTIDTLNGWKIVLNGRRIVWECLTNKEANDFVKFYKSHPELTDDNVHTAWIAHKSGQTLLVAETNEPKFGI